MTESAETIKGNSTRPQNTDTAALLDAWAHRYRRALLRYFQKRAWTTAAVDLEDLVQEVFLRLAHRSDLGTIERADRYLFSTAASVLNDRWRRDAVRTVDTHESFDETLHGLADFPPERVLIGQEFVEALISAMEELPERTRTAFALYHFEEFPHARIASQLGMAISTVEKHMARANAHLLRRLGRLR